MTHFIGFIPTEEEEVDSFFQLAPVTSSDVVYDLGSGDGRLLFTAIEKGAGRAVGVELNPKPLQKAAELAKKKRLEDRVSFIQGDVMDVDLSPATVVLCYLSPEASVALKPKLESELKYGTRVVMEWFGVPGWKPVKTLHTVYREFYLYAMPPMKAY